MKRTKTHINEIARRALNITRDEYALCAYLFFRQAYPSKAPGWCDDTREEMAYFIGITRQGLFKMFSRLERIGLVEQDAKTGYYRATAMFADADEGVNKVYAERKQSLHGDVNKVYAERKQSLPNINKKEKKEKRERKKETAPQAAFPSTAPPENEIQTAVTVAGEVGTLEADFVKIPPPVPPPPPAWQKTRRATKAETMTAEILSHLKGEVVDYFHAIHAAWQEWSRYKADEKRSRYKPQGAARTITALFNETGGDAKIGREAIRFSMEKNWAGIFMPKQSDKHAAPAQRYSLADRPQCEHTPDGLLAELRAFYTASPGLLCAAQEYAGTKYGANDLKAIIQKFCANQVGKGRCANTFEQHHADLSVWLLNQKKFEQQANQGPKDNNPYSNRPDGPKTRSDVNPYARHKIIS